MKLKKKNFNWKISQPNEYRPSLNLFVRVASVGIVYEVCEFRWRAAIFSFNSTLLIKRWWNHKIRYDMHEWRCNSLSNNFRLQNDWIEWMQEQQVDGNKTQ